MLQRALAAAPAALLRPRADAADGARLARAATTGLSTPGPLSGIPCLRVAPAMACMRTWAAPQGTAGTPRAARRSLSTETSRIAGGRTSRSAVRRTQIRTLNAVSAESKTAPPQSEEILRTIVRPYQSQERLLDRIIPDHELKLEPIVISKSDPVPFSAGTVDKKELWKVEKIQALVHRWANAEPFGIVELDKRIFGLPPRPDILHRVVVWQHNMMRSGTANTQTRATARGSNRKLRPQKGSGRARLGHRRSPMLAKGGRAHGPKPRNPATKIQRKVVDLAKRIALSTKYAQRQLVVVDSLSMQTDKTKQLHEALAAHELVGRMVLLVYGNEEPEVNLIQAAMPYRRVLPIAARDVDVFNILKFDTVVLDTDAVVVLEEMLGRTAA